LGAAVADTLQSVFIGGAAGLVSAIITHLSTRAKVRLDLAAEYDKNLQESRLEAYKLLWAMLEPMAKYGREPVTHAVIRSISDKTRTWYLREGERLSLEDLEFQELWRQNGC
jgi:hypothetical protein